MKKALNLKDKNFKKKVIATLITILSIIAIRVDCPYFDGIIIIVTFRLFRCSRSNGCFSIERNGILFWNRKILSAVL